MGGFGSGRGSGKLRKTTVEEAQALGIGDLQSPLFPGVTGELTWTRDGREIATAGYRVRGSRDWPVLSLYYESRNNSTHLPIRLQTTSPHFGGHRLWFTCPTCKHRVGKLFRPPGYEHFACRHCHDLRYRSSQNAHKRERLSKALAKMRERLAARRQHPSDAT